MRRASEAGLYYPALMMALVFPDICASLSAENGRTSGSKYRAWLVEHAAQPKDEAALLYGFRCSMLHQGSAFPDRGDFPLAFIEPTPGASQLHNLSTVVGDSRIGWLSVPLFVEEIATAVENWVHSYESSETVMRNMERFVRRRPEGLPPHVVGAPVIA